MKTNQNNITGYLHCRRCLEEIPPGQSPEQYARLAFGQTKIGFQLWCTRHDCNIMHVDFEGARHPADLTAARPSRNTTSDGNGA